MKRIAYILQEMLFLIRRHKAYFLAPLLILMAFLVILIKVIGPPAVLSFIYAGL